MSHGLSPSVVHIKRGYYARSLSWVEGAGGVGPRGPSYSLRSCAGATECRAVSEVGHSPSGPPGSPAPLFVRGRLRADRGGLLFLSGRECRFRGRLRRRLFGLVFFYCFFAYCFLAFCVDRSRVLFKLFDARDMIVFVWR